jgi:hypothetical protein
MRKFILITAMVLASATAQAGGSRSLTLASSEPPIAAEQPKTAEQRAVEQKPAETPKAVEAPAAGEAPTYVARPAPVGTATEVPRAETTNPVAEKATRTSKVAKPKRRRESTEARVIRELHRHGIYW